MVMDLRAAVTLDIVNLISLSTDKTFGWGEVNFFDLRIQGYRIDSINFLTQLTRIAFCVKF